MFQQCIKSVQSQTYAKQIEHLIIDGASNDGTLDIIRNYERKGWVTYYSEPDEGIYNAMNKGIAKAKGKYIAFLNSDDYYFDANAVEHSLELLEGSQAAFSYGKVQWVIDENYDGWLPDDMVWEPSIGKFFMCMPFSHQSMIARTEILRNYGGFDESYHIIADYDLISRLMLGGEKPIYVPQIMANCSFGGISTDMDHIGMHAKERMRLWRSHYGDIIGENVVDGFLEGQISSDLSQVLASFVHPSIVPFLPKAEQEPKIKEDASETDVLVQCTYYFAHFLPLFSSKSTKLSWILYLFACIPLLTYKRKNKVWHVRLFGFIPFLKGKKKGCSSRIRLFGLIPIFRLRTKHTEV